MWFTNLLFFFFYKFVEYVFAAAAKSLQSCPTLCDPRDGSPPGSLIPGILQARTLEWGALAFSNAWKWKVKVKLLSRVRLSATPWTAACQAPPSMGFSRQEYWSGVPSPSLNEKTTSPQKRHSKFRSGIGSPSKWKQQKVRPPCTGLQERCKWKQWKKGELQVRAPSSRKVRFLQ